MKNKNLKWVLFFSLAALSYLSTVRAETAAETSGLQAEEAVSAPAEHTQIPGEVQAEPAQETPSETPEPTPIPENVNPIDHLNYVQHKVAPGESLFVIAKKYKTTIDLIKTANGLTKDVIHPGQETYPLSSGIRALGISWLWRDLKPLGR